MGCALLLAAVLGAGRIPIPEAAMQFPDSRAFVGSGAIRESNMLAAAIGDTGRALRSAGPGPQQLAARWFRGELNAQEKVAVLLGGAVFHDRSMLPVYMDAVRSPDLRVRQAAAAGFFALAGTRSPLPSQMPDTPQAWQQLHRMIRALSWALEERPLVRVWVDSYLDAIGIPVDYDKFTFRTPRTECLSAIREIAEPADLPEILALWPMVPDWHEQAQLVKTIEMISMQRLVEVDTGPRAPSGDWQIRGAIASVDSWVRSLCTSVDGERQLEIGLRRNRLLDEQGEAGVATWIAVLRFHYLPFWPLAADRLMDLGARAVKVDRQNLENPANESIFQPLASQFPITAALKRRPSRARGVESRRGRR